ncbi:MBL fold metallo-hydrolase [Porphyromonas crevioricanis]|uniref:Beta-lactamase n=1 Tax=Porphyromonas crevioricanis TaxID=393921 RepID=A0A2X4SU74_9PORP|nr:MBL fold metallo-hydrolase [Porphyromonas crevioricanis]KGN93502.1 beta-lactamase [Porphyromonas crevioricanis]GAD08274.1 metallo-beta-lactamase family protein [Porphyromonas crevioricanis JCM 13913]SQH73371.1 Hydroxyacylglutathione hydrolase [Porphyromonas crevioricanis]
MKVEQIYTGCLAQGAYYISSEGEAAIIDPLRDTKPYLDRLAHDAVQLKYIFETHFHADFVSGHLDLSHDTGAQIVYGPTAKPGFEAIVAEDNQIFKVGKVSIRVIHTPGHTMESSCFLLTDEEGHEHALFSGDTLFLGDVGRPDLAQKAANLTKEELAGLLYDSLYNKILPLADDIVIYPAHGAGSACGKNMMKETVDTLGNQKRVNYAFNQPSREAFIASVIDGLLPPPAYFGGNVAMNKLGYDHFEKVLGRSLEALSPDEFESKAKLFGALILDTRAIEDFAPAFIPQSVNIGVDGDFAPWAGAMIIDVQQPILIVADPGREEEVITRLGRVGFDHVLGYLGRGFESWLASGKQIDRVERISAEQFAHTVDLGIDLVIDVRKESEFLSEHVEGADNKPLDYINDWIGKLPRDRHFYLHCAGGYRSMIAASILQARGYRNFTDIIGGFSAIAQTNISKTDFVCQSRVSKK